MLCFKKLTSANKLPLRCKLHVMCSEGGSNGASHGGLCKQPQRQKVAPAGGAHAAPCLVPRRLASAADLIPLPTADAAASQGLLPASPCDPHPRGAENELSGSSGCSVPALACSTS